MSGLEGGEYYGKRSDGKSGNEGEYLAVGGRSGSGQEIGGPIEATTVRGGKILGNENFHAAPNDDISGGLKGGIFNSDKGLVDTGMKGTFEQQMKEFQKESALETKEKIQEGLKTAKIAEREEWEKEQQEGKIAIAKLESTGGLTSIG